MTADLIPVTALLDLEDKARETARALLPLVAATFRAQFPTGAYLVLRRTDGELTYESVRDAQGETVFQFPESWWKVGRLPNPVPDEIAFLWGDEEGRDLGIILELLERIDHYGVLKFLPDAVMRQGEGALDKTPVCVPLAPPEPAATCR